MNEYKIAIAYGYRVDGTAYRVELKYPINASSMKEVWGRDCTIKVTGSPNSEELKEIYKSINNYVKFQLKTNKLKIGASNEKKSKIGS